MRMWSSSRIRACSDIYKFGLQIATQRQYQATISNLFYDIIYNTIGGINSSVEEFIVIATVNMQWGGQEQDDEVAKMFLIAKNDPDVIRFRVRSIFFRTSVKLRIQKPI